MLASSPKPLADRLQTLSVTIGAVAAVITALGALDQAAATLFNKDSLTFQAAGIGVRKRPQSPAVAPPAEPGRQGQSPRPVVRGRINIPQTGVVDLDTGGLVATGDIWFEAQTPTLFFLVPVNGAKMSVEGLVAGGYAGCAGANYAVTKVNLATVPPGAFVCVRTKAGRIAQFRVNKVWGAPTKTLNINYTTWN